MMRETREVARWHPNRCSVGSNYTFGISPANGTIQ